MRKKIYVQGKPYYHYGNYKTRQAAFADAQRILKDKKTGKKKTKQKGYFIIKVEKGFWFPEDVWALYLRGIIKILG